MHDVLALGQVGQAHASRVEPLLPGLEVGELRLDLVLFDDAPLGGVDEEHATGAQASAALDALGGEVEHAGLAADHDEAVGRLGPPPGAEPVAVERRADQRAVGEDQRGGAVPGLHLHGVVVVERAQLRIDVRLLLVRLGHHHHDRVRQAATGQGEQLEHLVERRGVARTLGADRQERADVAEQLGLELRLARPHPVAVAVDGVDLAVVREHAQRLRERPGREGVGGVAGVHDGQLGGEPLVLQVGVERLELECRDHALVPEGAGRERDDVGAELGAGALAQAEHAAVELDARQGGRIADRRDARRTAARTPGGRRTRACRGSRRRSARRASRAARGSRSRRSARCPAFSAARRSSSRGRKIMPAAYSPTGGSSKSTTARRKASGICVRMPAPSPVPASEPIAPRCSRLRSAVRARSMMSCPASPRRVATMASPHASFSKAGLYIPCLGGSVPKAWSAAP